MELPATNSVLGRFVKPEEERSVWLDSVHADPVRSVTLAEAPELEPLATSLAMIWDASNLVELNAKMDNVLEVHTTTEKED